MSEIIDNSRLKKKVLKEMILRLHEGEAPDAVRAQLVRLLGEVPYGLVVEVEQELIEQGMPASEIQKLCDVHSAALKGIIGLGGSKSVQPGHPVHTFIEENRALARELGTARALCAGIEKNAAQLLASGAVQELSRSLASLAEVDKHYRRKENLLFPLLEKHGITGPSTVMWGKDDEARKLIAGAREALAQVGSDPSELSATVALAVEPALGAIEEMIFKEEKILFPMALDTLTTAEWLEVYRQSPEIGFCLFVPTAVFEPDGVAEQAVRERGEGTVRLRSGSMTVEELGAVLDTLPFDLTFVDREDRVRYFTQGKERIFDRNLAILGRKVQHCHPPASVHVVQQILEDFKAGRQSRAPFWINFRGKFVHIEYFAVRGPRGEYLGTLEVTQDLTELRKLEGEQRLLSYVAGGGK